MTITITQNKKGKWVLVSDGDLLTKDYGTLYTLAKALVKWAKGQNL